MLYNLHAPAELSDQYDASIIFKASAEAPRGAMQCVGTAKWSGELRRGEAYDGPCSLLYGNFAEHRDN